MDPDRILNTIKEKGVTPISRKHFVFRRFLVFSFGIIVTILGGIAFAKIIADVLTVSWQDWDYVFANFNSFIYFAMPISWIGSLIVFVVLIPFIVEKTNNGYKYKKIILILFSILTSIILGLIILKIGAYTGVNKIFTNSVEKREAIIWTDPDDGLLAGKITNRGTDSIIIQDFRGKIWAVDVSHVLDLSKEIANSEENVRLIGVEIDDNTFLACQVLPFSLNGFPVIGDEVDHNNLKSKKPSQMVSDICSLVLKDNL